MTILTLCLGPFATNCYLLWQHGLASALLVDCAGRPDQVLEALAERKLELRLIVNTHGHADHTEALAAVQEATGCEVTIHELDAALLDDSYLSGAALFGLPQPQAPPARLLNTGDLVELPETDVRLTVLHTPGHTPGSICLLGEGILFSGDTLFAGGIGRTDLPGGDTRAMLASLARLAQLGPELIVYPGHGPATTIGDERKTNPWLKEL